MIREAMRGIATKVREPLAAVAVDFYRDAGDTGGWLSRGGGLLGDDAQEALAVGGELLFADAADAVEVGEGLRAQLGDGAQGGVSEDDVGGDTLLLGLGRTPNAQRLEQRDVGLGEIDDGSAGG